MATGHIDTTILGNADANTQNATVADPVKVRALFDELAGKNDGNYDFFKADYDNAIGMMRQALINGNFDVWQRGTSFTNPAANSYTSDRFTLGGNTADGGSFPTNIIHSRQILTSGDIANSYFFYRVNVDGAGTSYGVNSFYRFSQKIENGVRYLCGNGKKITISFWARSSIPNKKIGLSASQTYGGGGSPSASEVINGNKFTLTSTWTKYSYTFTTNTLVGKNFGSNNDDALVIQFNHQWGANNAIVVGDTIAETFVGVGNIDIAQVQVTAGDQALPFQPRSFAEELALCQRYYEKSYNTVQTASDPAETYQTRTAINASTSGVLTYPVRYKVSKRSNVSTVTIFSTDGTANAVRLSGVNRTGVTAFATSEKGFQNLSIDATSANAIALDQSVTFAWTCDSEL